MPDKRKHRGRHPEDDRLFATAQLPALRSAVDDYAWLLTHGYAEVSALQLVGDHLGLTQRQRMAVRRSTCSDQALHTRESRRVEPDAICGRTLLIDGYNLLITIESALSGGLVFVGRDGCYRDIASVHGTYRKVEETIPAVDLIIRSVSETCVADATILLDRPVKNSGRLRALIEERTGTGAPTTGKSPAWHIELCDSPDAGLVDSDDVVATSDSVVLDRSACWVNLAGWIIDRNITSATVIDLRIADALGD